MRHMALMRAGPLVGTVLVSEENRSLYLKTTQTFLSIEINQCSGYGWFFVSDYCILTYMLKKFLKILILFAIISFVIHHYFFYIDLSNGCFIKIKPSIFELSTNNIKKAIKILKHATPDEYLKLCTHVKTINPNPSCGGFGGGCFYTRYNGQIEISTSNKSFLGQTAAIIVHETCHAIQHNEKRDLNEPECYGLDNEVLKSLIAY